MNVFPTPPAKAKILMPFNTTLSAPVVGVPPAGTLIFSIRARFVEEMSCILKVSPVTKVADPLGKWRIHGRVVQVRISSVTLFVVIPPVDVRRKPVRAVLVFTPSDKVTLMAAKVIVGRNHHDQQEQK